MDVDDDTLAGGDVPSIEGIQQTLVNINDKPSEFLHSTDWLGALEVSETTNWQVWNVSKWTLNWTYYADILCDWYFVRCTMSHSTHPVQSRHSQIFQYHQIPFREFRRLNYDGRWHGCIIQRYCGHPHCRQRCLSADCGECVHSGWSCFMQMEIVRFIFFCLFCFSIATIDILHTFGE